MSQFDGIDPREDGWPEPWNDGRDSTRDTLNLMAGDGGRQHWKTDGLCAQQNPDLWDLDFYSYRDLPYEHNSGSYSSVARVAQRLCEGCPVKRMCAVDALRPMYSGRQGGGVAMVGVIRAGVPMRSGRDGGDGGSAVMSVVTRQGLELAARG